MMTWKRTSGERTRRPGSWSRPSWRSWSRRDETLRTIARELVVSIMRNLAIDWTIKESVSRQPAGDGEAAPTRAMTEHLVSHQRCLDRIRSAWPAFRATRDERLKQQERHGVAAEKVAANILEDLFTTVLDWSLGDLNNQVEYADLVLTRFGIKYLVVEVKRPSALAWNRRAVEVALTQARTYADRQGVRCVSVSDGVMLYAADIDHGVLRGRMCVALDGAEPQDDLWWLGEHGIYRPCNDAEEVVLRLLPKETPASDSGSHRSHTTGRFSTTSTSCPAIASATQATRATPQRGSSISATPMGASMRTDCPKRFRPS